MACIGRDIMPTVPRGDISDVKPSGWVQASYDIVDGKYLYNRSHLIGWQLTGEDDNKQNLITGTRSFNQLGMLPFENMVADYIKETNNHVLYRITPVFVGNELVARGVLMEAWSVEDNGDGICFNVFVYNVQPGVIIDYATGKSRLENDDSEKPGDVIPCDYIANKNSKTFHYPNCSSVAKMSEKNKEYHTATHDEMIEKGYSPCGNCNP
jgi:DNA-entry nuclease